MDIQVEGVAHYLTVSGLVNQNCIKFDELTHFSENTFFYMQSRNRSVSGIRPYIRATCNAEADSWVSNFISWWIDWDTGLPILERAGAIRWFVRTDQGIIWDNDPGKLPWVSVEIDGEMVPQPPRSVTFIPAKVTDNKTLLRENPEYLASLLALPPVERAQLLEGNWKIRPAAGLYFKRHWFEVVDAVPAQAKRVRRWDLAATKPKAGKDPDWTAGAKVSRDYKGLFYIEDIRRDRDTPGEIEALIKYTAQADGRGTPIYIEQEPGSSGKSSIDHYIRELAGFQVYPDRVTGPKDQRIKPVSSQAQAGNVRLVRGDWNEAFLAEAEQYPEGKHDDQLDAVAGGFDALNLPVITGNRTAVSPERPILSRYAPR